MEFGICGRGTFCVVAQDSDRRPRTPDTLKDRGRAELTGMKGSDEWRLKGSLVEKEFEEDNVDVSVEGGIAEATRICDCDIGVSDDSDSLSAVEKRSCCDAVGVRS